MIERFQGSRLVKTAREIHSPERLKGKLPVFGREHLLQIRSDGAILAVGDQAQRRLPRPSIGAGQLRHEFPCAQAR